MMSVSEILETRNAFSFEVFPPKTDAGMEKLCGEGGVLDKLYTLNPDYISCTYGAGGTNVGKNLEVLKKIQTDGKCIPVTHFTCIGNTKEGIKEQLQTYLDNGINHMLALRGDLPFGWTGTGGDLHYATELVKFVRQEFGDKFTIAVAGSPEGHIACRSLEADIAFLKQKQDNGADYIMTQLCWDMDQFRYWLDAIRAAGVWMPVDVGIMPILDQAATINMALSRNGCVMPRELCEIISKNWIFPNPFDKEPFDADVEGKKASFKEAGIEYTIRQIDEYRACGINGIHLYALNKYDDVARIAKEAGLLDLIYHPHRHDQGGLRRIQIQLRTRRGRRLRYACHGPHPGQGLLLLCQRGPEDPDRQVRQKLSLSRHGQRGGAGACGPGDPAPCGYHASDLRLLPPRCSGGSPDRGDDRGAGAEARTHGPHCQPRPGRRFGRRSSPGDRTARSDASGRFAPGRGGLPLRLRRGALRQIAGFQSREGRTARDFGEPKFVILF